MNKSYVGDGHVVLIAGGGKTYTDIAARFVRSERSIDDIIASPEDRHILENILDSGHMAATEFDYFLFGVEGYARVTEIQLVRKRLASYMIKSGRAQKDGKRSFDVVVPKNIETFKSHIDINPHDVMVDAPSFGIGQIVSLADLGYKTAVLTVSSDTILKIIEHWYNDGVTRGYKEEELRYMKPQATEFKAIIGMNAHALLDWFGVRTCMNAQTEIRDMACKVMTLCRDAAPVLFRDAGPNCKRLGYCPENARQNSHCVGKVLTKDQAFRILNIAQRRPYECKYRIDTADSMIKACCNTDNPEEICNCSDRDDQSQCEYNDREE